MKANKEMLNEIIKIYDGLCYDNYMNPTDPNTLEGSFNRGYLQAYWDIIEMVEKSCTLE